MVRDSQVSKVATALTGYDPNRIGRQEFQTTAQVDVYISKITRSAWWKKRDQGNAGSIRVYGPTTRIEVLLGLAKRLRPKGTAAHGPECMKELVALVERFEGKAAKDRLLINFKANRVKYITWSPEAREAARQRALDKGTPFTGGVGRLEIAKDGMIDLLRSLSGQEYVPPSDDEIETIARTHATNVLRSFVDGKSHPPFSTAVTVEPERVKSALKKIIDSIGPDA